MPLFAFGINHNTASATVRERVTFTPERIPSALRDLAACDGVREAAILCTCNRTDLYCGIDDGDGLAVLNWFRHIHGLTLQEIRHYLYIHRTKEAARHMMRVACGLDSMILGEPQILGQIKDAYRTAFECGTIGHVLGRLFQQSFSVAKRVRTDTGIGESPVSVAFAAVTLARRIFGNMTRLTALLIGAGETMGLVARHLNGIGLQRIIIANRTLANARHLAAETGGYAISLDEIPAHLPEADMVFSATTGQMPILTREQVVNALKKRKHRPVYMVDMAIPRDIEPAVEELEDIYLYTVDDLGEVIRENLLSRQDAARQAEEIIDTQVAHFMGWLGTLDTVPAIRTVRGRGEATRDEVLVKAKRLLASGARPEDALDFLANTLTSKLLHRPTIALRAAGFDGDRERVETIRRVFGE
uniref:Glutamyl-tRNA reductase n=1 Tax=Candidatus Kentrum sp. DK TaxID=2126562 RepID=A0A450SPM0_9GAMM|nr:MAG: glutamyl-tRNA reductase [Candidatus Kentron sp. DK]